MIENRDQKNQIFYCKECGWNISCYDVEKIYGEKNGAYFCYQCGKNLVKKEDDSHPYIKHNSQINNEYSIDFLAYCELLYEEIGSIRAICRKLEQEGYIYERRKLKSKLEKKFEQEGRDFERWFNQYKKYQRGIYYKDSEIDTWISMYEKIGNFSEISRILTSNDKNGPDDKTITKRIREKLVYEGRDFDSWKSHFKSVNTSHFLPNYNYSDAKEWKKFYEKQGSYRSVAEIIGVGHHTIKKYISQLSDKEEWDFERWEEKYSSGRYKYDEQDLELWIQLYEEFGSFLAISSFLAQNFNQSPDSKNIKKRLLELFRSRGWDFNEWIEINKAEGLYSNNDVLEWKTLYEELGNFTAVSNFFNEKFGEGPDPTTVKNRLKSLSIQEGWNFKKWTISFYNDNSKRHYLIGKYIHWILECLFIEYTIKHDLKGFFEIMPNRLNGSLKSVDNVLFKSPFNIINIDYTISTYKRVFLNKCKKGYQSLNRRLILVSLNTDNIEDLLRNNKYPYKENVKIFDTNKFAKYMKYYGNYLENYYDAIGIMKESFTDDFFLKKLVKTAKEAKIKLEKFHKIYAISQEDYELEIRWWNKH